MTFSGLSEREAEASRQKYGLNELKDETRFGDKILCGINSLSCKLFIIAAMVKVIILLLGLLEIIPQVKDISGIFVLVGLAAASAFLEAFLRYSSEKRISAISRAAHQSSYTVLRSSGKMEITEEKMLAAGDIVYLSEGDFVPADGIVADGQFTVDQSEFGMLEKLEKTAPPSSFHSNRASGLKNAYSLYRGSVICKGNGAFRITAVGGKTLIAENKKNTPVIHGENFGRIVRTGGIIGACCAGAVLIFFIISGAASGQLLKGILEGLSAAAVILSAACFCGRNLITEASAASAMKKLESQGMKIAAPDILSNISEAKLLLTDKTGMLTEGSYQVSGFIDGNGKQVAKAEEVDEKIMGLIKTAVVNTSTAKLENDGTFYGGSPVDRAIIGFVRSAQRINVKKQASAKAMGLTAVTINLDGKLATFFSGGAENILAKCGNSFSVDGKKRRITNKDALLKLAETLSLTGSTVRAYAVSDKVIKNGNLPEGSYTLIGMVVLRDRLCEDAAEAVELLDEYGVRTIYLTDASREELIYAMKNTGGKKKKGVILSSEQLAKMQDKELKKRFSDIGAVVRADEKDKLRILRMAEELEIKTCVAAAAPEDCNVLAESNAAISAPVCTSAVRNASDASADGCGLRAAAALYKYSAGFVNRCRFLLLTRIVCTVILAAISIISVIGW